MSTAQGRKIRLLDKEFGEVSDSVAKDATKWKKCHHLTSACLVILMLMIAFALAALIVTWEGYGSSMHYRGKWWTQKTIWANDENLFDPVDDACPWVPQKEYLAYEQDALGNVVCPDVSIETKQQQSSSEGGDGEYSISTTTTYYPTPSSSTTNFHAMDLQRPRNWNNTPSAGVPNTPSARKVLFSPQTLEEEGDEAQEGYISGSKINALGAAWAMFIANDISKSNYPRHVSLPASNTVSWQLDGSSIYGSTRDVESAMARLNHTSAKLYSTKGYLDGEILPLEVERKIDFRSTTHVLLSALHTLFIREHNRAVAEIIGDEKYKPFIISKRNVTSTQIDDSTTEVRELEEEFVDMERVFRFAKSRVVAMIQSITINEWVPAVLGPYALSDPCLVRPEHREQSIRLEAALALSTFGQIAISAPQFNLVNMLTGNATKRYTLKGYMGDAGVSSVLRKHRLEDILLGGFTTRSAPYDNTAPRRYATELDIPVINGVHSSSNYIPSGPCGSPEDLECARSLGAYDYCTVRHSMGCVPIGEWETVVGRGDDRDDTKWRMSLVYGEPSDGGCYNTDLVSGLLVEDGIEGASTLMGKTSTRLIAHQIQRLMDSDPLFYLWNANVIQQRNEYDKIRFFDVLLSNMKVRSDLDKDLRKRVSIAKIRLSGKNAFLMDGEKATDIKYMNPGENVNNGNEQVGAIENGDNTSAEKYE